MAISEREEKVVSKGYLINGTNAFYVAIVPVPGLQNPQPFPDEIEPIEDSDTIFFRRQRLFVQGLRDATIEFLKDGMMHTFHRDDALWNEILALAPYAGAFDNEAVVTLRTLFKAEGMDFIAFMDLEQEKVGLSVKLEMKENVLAEAEIKDKFAKAIDNVIVQINREDPASKRPSLEERIRTIIEESERDEDLDSLGLGGIGGPLQGGLQGGLQGSPFEPAVQDENASESHIDVDVLRLLDGLLEEEEEEEEKEQDKEEKSVHKEDPNKFFKRK